MRKNEMRNTKIGNYSEKLWLSLSQEEYLDIGLRSGDWAIRLRSGNRERRVEIKLRSESKRGDEKASREILGKEVFMRLFSGSHSRT